MEDGEREKIFVYMYTLYIQCRGFASQNQGFFIKVPEGELEKHQWGGLIFNQLLITERTTPCFTEQWPKQWLTLGVKRYTIPLVDPFSVKPRIRKMVSTTYGRVDVTYTACTKKNHINKQFK